MLRKLGSKTPHFAASLVQYSGEREQSHAHNVGQYNGMCTSVNKYFDARNKCQPLHMVWFDMLYHRERIIQEKSYI